MRRRPQSAIIPILSKDKQEISTNNSQHIYKQQHQSFIAPKEYFEDHEQLYYSNLQLKQQTNELRYQNQKLKAQISQLQSHISKISKVDNPLDQDLNPNMVPIFKVKVKQQRNLIEELQSDIQNQSKSLKFTKIQELQTEISNLHNQISKFKQVLQTIFKVSDQDIIKDPNIIDKISKFQSAFNQQQNSISHLVSENEQLKKQYQEISNHNSKLQDKIKLLIIEKNNVKKQCNYSTNPQNDTKNKDFIEKKLISTLQQFDSLKNELVLSETKSKMFTKQIKEQERELNNSILELQKQKQQLEEQCLKKDQIIQDLNNRINIIELLKQKSPQSSVSITQDMKKQFFPILNQQDQVTQFPEQENKQVLIQPINNYKLQILFLKLKYKIISLKLTKDRIQMCFNNKQFVQLGEAIEIFMKSPFNFQYEESILICRYLIGEDQGNSNKIQLEDTQEVKEIINKFENHPKISSKYLTWKSINSQFIKQLHNKINELDIERKVYNSDELILLLKQIYNLSYESIEYILMMYYIYLNETESIDWNKMRKIIADEYQLQKDNRQLTYSCNESVRYIPIQQDKIIDSNDEYLNYQIVQNKNQTQVPQQQQQSIEEISINMKLELDRKVHSILKNEQVLTFSQFDQLDNQLKSSESRKSKITGELFQYSQTEYPKGTVNKQTELQLTSSEHSLQYNMTNQTQSPLVFNMKNNLLCEYESGNQKQIKRNLKYNEIEENDDNDKQVVEEL